MQLISRHRSLDLATPVVMGIVNVTPDSFSDGGRFFDLDAAYDEACRMLEAGASIVDIGGESTRPGAEPVPAAEQIDRVLPLLERLRASTDRFISIDSGSAAVIEAVAEAGADLINDVYALRQPAALEAAAHAGLAVCLMHMQGKPATMQDAPAYDDAVAEILQFLKQRAEACLTAGIDAAGLLLDPGFGFGKTDAHNLELLASFGTFGTLGYPLMIGVSRKGTLGSLTGRGAKERLAAGLAAAVIAVRQGAGVVRTHDVPETVDAIKIVDAVGKATAQAAVGPAG